MVKTINKSVCRGVAGRRVGKVKGVVIHNTADNLTAKQHMNRLARMSPQQLQAGFCHYFIDESTIVRTEDTYNMAWHTANPDGNANYIGYEVCRSTGNQSNFLQAEQNTFKQVAEDLKYYGLPANRSTVRLHREFVPTSCPHRSWDIHGKSVNAVKDYFIKEINKYMKGEQKIVDRSKHYVVTGGYRKDGHDMNKVVNWLKKEGMNYKIKTNYTNNVRIEVGTFPMVSPWKRKLEDFLGKNKYNYQVVDGNNLDNLR